MENTNESGPVEEWVTLKEAERLTGVPVRTLRAWYGSDKIQSRMMASDAHGPHREVIVAEVQARAERRQTPPPTEPTPPLAAGPVPEGAMLVPLSAWESMMEQLGHLHDAGRELADARERAGRAEEREAFQLERRQIEQERREAAEARVAELEARLAAGNVSDVTPEKRPEPTPSPAEEPDIISPTLISQVEQVAAEESKPWWQRLTFQIPGRK
jgi:DNA-binding transcriptional MerR regulator